VTPGLYLAIGYAVLLSTSAVHPAADDALASCAAIDDSSARLACYDKLAGRQVPPGTGKWRLEHRSSLLSGGDALDLSLYAEQADATALPPWLQPRIVVTCDDHQTQVMIIPQRRVSTSDGDIDILLRIDGGDETREVWHISPDGVSIVRPNSGDWIQSLFGATRLQVGIRPYPEPPVGFSFIVEGLETASEPLAKACGW
jgi:hypothetical protein